LLKTINAFWSIKDCALVFAADMLAGLVARVKKWRRKEMLTVAGLDEGGVG